MKRQDTHERIARYDAHARAHCNELRATRRGWTDRDLLIEIIARLELLTIGYHSESEWAEALTNGVDLSA